MQIIIGCCGFPVGIEKYAKVFSAVEIQQTFYRFIQEKVAENWLKKVNKENFQFTIKAHQFITHNPGKTYAKAGIVIPEEKKENYGGFKLTDEVLNAWKHTLKIARILNAKVILLQSPPSYNENLESIKNIKNFLERVKTKEFLIFWEIRGKWSDETIKDICEEFEIYQCVDPTIRKPITQKYYYFRLHGGLGYRHTYTQEELEKLADEIRKLNGEEIYVFFNNINMFNDAQKFQALIHTTLL